MPGMVNGGGMRTIELWWDGIVSGWMFLKALVKRSNSMRGIDMSKCRYVMCKKCNALFDKNTTLNGFPSNLRNHGQVIVSGTRTCKCGNVMQVADIYAGLHDLPRQYWNQVAGPVEVE
jgi:hypothetical protein